VYELFGPQVKVNMAGSGQTVQVPAALLVDALRESMETWPDWLVLQLRAVVRREALKRSKLLAAQTKV